MANDIIDRFKNLSKFYDNYLRLEDVEKIYQKALESSDNNDAEISQPSPSKKRHFNRSNEMIPNGNDSNESDDSDDEPLSHLITTANKINSIEEIPMVKEAIENEQVLSTIQDLCTILQNIRESNSGYDNTFDCWDRVHEVSPRQKYFAFIFSLLRLAHYDPTSVLYWKLSISAASLYVLSLTIPGAKQFHIFDEEMINYTIEIFYLLNIIHQDNVRREIHQHNRVQIWINFGNFCDKLKIMFRYVHFNECTDIRNTILREMSKVMFNLHVNGHENVYAIDFHRKCFEIYDEVINAHNGDPQETLMKIMKINYCHHIFPPVRHDGQTDVHISEWFVSIINKYPRILSEVLKNYIKCVVTNPEKHWRTEHIQKALDYANKYDSALYTKCNESILDFLFEATQCDDPHIRSNAIDLLFRMTQIESRVDWELFRHEISSIPREVYIIKELIGRLLDTNNSIKLKVLNGLNQTYIRGSPETLKIMNEGTRFALFNCSNIDLPEEPRPQRHEIRYQKPEAPIPTYTFIGHEIIAPLFSKLPDILYFLIRNPSAHTRRAALILLETIANLNPLVIYNTNFVKEISRLGDDSTPLVRKQALTMIDSILSKYPNCYPVIVTWCKIIFPIFKDNDSKLIELACECFKRRVLQNIRAIENTNEAEHFMPWVILRVILSSQQRQFLQSVFNSVIHQNEIDQNILVLIESHILTANSTEAWALLSLIAGKVKLKEPDSLVSKFLDALQIPSWNANQNLQIILEILAIYIQDFSHSVLNMAHRYIVDRMKNGTIPPYVISKAFNLCLSIIAQSDKKKQKDNSIKQHNQQEQEQQQNIITYKKMHSPKQIEIIEEIYETIENYLVENINNYHNETPKIFSYLFSYSELNLELPNRYPHVRITNFISSYLMTFNRSPNDFHPEDMNLLNLIIILAARFSIRDRNFAKTTCELLCDMLNKTERPQTVTNILMVMGDLCKTYTHIIEKSLPQVLKKLHSEYAEIRSISFKNLSQMVLQDSIKLRGNLLLNLLAALLDKDVRISNRVTEFFLTYIEKDKRNSRLFFTCLNECPYLFNEYMDYEGFQSFSDLKIISPIKGDEKIKSRQSLYRVFICDQDEAILLSYFDNLQSLYSKVKNQPSIKSDEGFATIKDIFFILKEICRTSKKDKTLSTTQSENIEDVLENVDNIALNETINQVNEQSTRGRGRKQDNQLTMAAAEKVVEKSINYIPKISEIITKWDPVNFEKSISELAIAICIRFENYTEFTDQKSFWSKYREKAKINKKQNPKCGKNSETIHNENENNTELITNSIVTETNTNENTLVSGNVEVTENTHNNGTLVEESSEINEINESTIQNYHNNETNYEDDDDINNDEEIDDEDDDESSVFNIEGQLRKKRTTSEISKNSRTAMTYLFAPFLFDCENF